MARAIRLTRLGLELALALAIALGLELEVLQRAFACGACIFR